MKNIILAIGIAACVLVVLTATMVIPEQDDEVQEYRENIQWIEGEVAYGGQVLKIISKQPIDAGTRMSLVYMEEVIEFTWQNIPVEGYRYYCGETFFPADLGISPLDKYDVKIGDYVKGITYMG